MTTLSSLERLHLELLDMVTSCLEIADMCSLRSTSSSLASKVMTTSGFQRSIESKTVCFRAADLDRFTESAKDLEQLCAKMRTLCVETDLQAAKRTPTSEEGPAQLKTLFKTLRHILPGGSVDCLQVGPGFAMVRGSGGSFEDCALLGHGCCMATIQALRTSGLVVTVCLDLLTVACESTTPWPVESTIHFPTLYDALLEEGPIAEMPVWPVQCFGQLKKLHLQMDNTQKGSTSSHYCAENSILPVEQLVRMLQWMPQLKDLFVLMPDVRPGPLGNYRPATDHSTIIPAEGLPKLDSCVIRRGVTAEEDFLWFAKTVQTKKLTLKQTMIVQKSAISFVHLVRSEEGVKSIFTAEGLYCV